MDGYPIVILNLNPFRKLFEGHQMNLLSEEGDQFKDRLPDKVNLAQIASLHQEIKDSFSKYRRTYLVIIPRFSFYGCFHSIALKSLLLNLRRFEHDIFESSRQFARLMASGDLTSGTLARIHKIDREESDCPPLILISIGDHLLKEEGLFLEAYEKK